MELTKEYFNHSLARLATKDDLKLLATKADLRNFVTKGDITNIENQLSAIQQTLSSHTSSLDALIKQTKDWNAEMAVMRQRMDRYENALKLVAEKVKINIKPLIN